MNLVRFKLAVVDINGKTEEAIKVIRVQDGTESCMIGILSRNIVISDKKRIVGRLHKLSRYTIFHKMKQCDERAIETRDSLHFGC